MNCDYDFTSEEISSLRKQTRAAKLGHDEAREDGLRAAENRQPLGVCWDDQILR